MALPVTITGTAFPPQNYFCGPFKSSAGNFYVTLLDSADASIIEAWKATDPTVSFAEQNAAGKPDLDANIQSLWAYQVGDVLHIASFANASTTEALAYHRFNMATDNWDEIETVVQANITAALNVPCSIAVRSDGDVIILYGGNTDSIHGISYERVDYARYEGVSWSVNNAVDNAGGVHWYGAVIVPGSSDRMHFFFKDDTNSDAYQRCLTSANALETFPSSFDTDVYTADHIFGPGVNYASGGQQKVRVPYLNDAYFNLAAAELDSADAPAVTAGAAINSVSYNVQIAGGTPIACFANDGTTIHVLFADSLTDDLYRDQNANDGGWGTDVEVLDAVTIYRISANVYTRGSATELAYVYNDGGTVKYNEYELDAGGPPVTQPYYVRTGGVPGMRIGRPGSIIGRSW